jgi:hypothetical protein
MNLTSTNPKQPQIHWIKDGAKAEIQNETLSFSNVQVISSESYWCHAVNEVGEVKKKFEVKVVELPVATSLAFDTQFQ